MSNTQAKGVICGLLAYLGWGLFPFYWKILDHVSPIEIMTHRIFWSAVSLILILIFFNRIKELIQVFRKKSNFFRYSISAFLISINWFLYIYAIIYEQTIEASLGYFICPLLVVFFSSVFFKEKLSFNTKVALGFIFLGVTLQVWLIGKLPWIALTLALTFALYGAIRKQGNLDTVLGLTVETLLVLPWLILFLFCFSGIKPPIFLNYNLKTDLLLIFSGIVTCIPLLLYGYAVQHTKFSTIGVLHYFSPSLQFMIGVFIFEEKFYPKTLLSFALVWIGILIFIRR